MKELLKKLKLNEANIGLGLGVAVLVLSGLLLVSYFRSINKDENAEKTSSAATDQPVTVTTGDATVITSADGVVVQPVAGAEYTVQKGDSLWKISMKTYGSGFAWTKIYEANKQAVGSNPNVLTEGTKLSLPEPEIAKVNYTVVKGDNLWNISVKICGDGFLWSKLAQDNNIPNPRLIEPGMKLNIKCR